MKPIELERWEPAPDDPRRKVYAGQRTAQEVFEELRYRLEGMGYLPDEYLFMDREWANGREIPRGAEIFCITDYGGSEGIYTDISLRWYQDGKSIIESFATGKTLGGKRFRPGPDVPHCLRHHQGIPWGQGDLRPVPSLGRTAGAGGHDPALKSR